MQAAIGIELGMIAAQAVLQHRIDTLVDGVPEENVDEIYQRLAGRPGPTLGPGGKYVGPDGPVRGVALYGLMFYLPNDVQLTLVDFWPSLTAEDRVWCIRQIYTGIARYDPWNKSERFPDAGNYIKEQEYVKGIVNHWKEKAAESKR
jgi:hypothetical protein